MSLGELADVVAYLLPFDVGFKVQLLADTNVERRARRVLEQLESAEPEKPASGSAEHRFPPDFSPN
jgi:hypothetical protein